MSTSNKSKSRGLGRGLSSLLSEGPVAAIDKAQPGSASEADAQVADRSLPIEKLQRNKSQPRRDFDEGALEALAESIRVHGILQPILVRPLPSDSSSYEIIAGERRWRAAQKAGLAQVPVVIRSMDDLGTLEAAIVENLQREDLNPIDEAMAFQQLMDRFARTQQSVADQVGKSRAYIANALRLLNLPPSAIELVRTGRLTPGHARAVLTAEHPEALAELIVSKGLSVRDAEKAAKRSAEAVNGGDLKPPRSASGADEDAKAVADNLSALLGLPVSIKAKGGQAGVLEVQYQSYDQLDHVCSLLSSRG